ncbi:hypothetical protein BDF21DRAFT_425148 [Thamnidium elegans]|nr:hypothetical protein BDF21DRAFT_425148 [Thamnidium elegans]
MYESSNKNKHCRMCNITFKRLKSFLDHELHFHKTKKTPIIDLETYYCNVCNKRFSTSALYRKHMANLNNIRIPRLRSKSKPKPKPKPNPLKKPDANHPNNYCMPCNINFRCQDYYNIHLIDVHHMTHLISSLSTIPTRKLHDIKNMKPTIDILNLYCDVCKKTYDTKASYTRHLLLFHEMKTLLDAHSEPSNFDLSNLYCKVCGIKYRQKPSFMAHLRNIHRTSPSSWPDLTPIVNDPNNYLPELYQGIDRKSPSKEDLAFKKYCADCQKAFLTKRLYCIHLDKIHGIKQKPVADDVDVNNPNNHCTLCNKTYLDKEAYRRHLINVHNMPVHKRCIKAKNTIPVMDVLKKYCNVCDRLYKTMDTYRYHLDRYHHVKLGGAEPLRDRVNRNKTPVIGEIDNYCTACDKIYKSVSSYKGHLYMVHGTTLTKMKFNTDGENKHCALCNRTFSSHRGYAVHLSAFHTMKKLEIKQEDTDEKLRI